MTTSTELIKELRVQSVCVPESRKHVQNNKSMDYLNWMAYTIKSVHYTKDQQLSDALLIFKK
jgi:hypothetical protein